MADDQTLPEVLSSRHGLDLVDAVL